MSRAKNKQPFQFTITRDGGRTSEDVTGRGKAVERAKKLSERRAVQVRRDDNRVFMVFREGNLEKYQFNTPR